MCVVYPDYYKDFKCIGGRCRHNCCIGWEIDIDADTAEYYKTVGGKIGDRLAKSVSYDGTPHFVLGENERCPFLNKDNLCDIIIELGEERLCTICDKHPRFENELPDRVEIGVGMACEEAARLILSKKEPTKLVGAPDTDDEIIILRDKAISALQDRERSIFDRILYMLSLCGVKTPNYTLPETADILLSLERLDEKWTDMLGLLRAPIDFDGFDAYMRERETEYEQILVYFVYRHMANAPSLDDAAARAAFAAFAYTVIRALGAAIWQQNGNFTTADHAELCRMFSSEIEYSDANLYILLDILSDVSS